MSFQAIALKTEAERSDEILLIVASAVAVLTLLPVAAHQFGLLRHLPDPKGSFFDSDRITESKAAHPLGVPDSLPGLCSYGASLALAIAAPRSTVARRLLGAKLMLDSAAAGFNFIRQIVTFRKLCSWCTGTVLATAAMVYAGRHRVIESTKFLENEVR